ncbi:Tho2p [Sugiyamaella lignohabitans]|uniref:Tho2p n=1 Tax=Sugiyamaella lignohabitans TaxID=796027 RepID=A0A167FQ22_9ASCO|nr:Tho2p [Sugiyamaella lignohabitans]ANB15555.1 Tho2p [Sugiyamaella lignohabitans]
MSAVWNMSNWGHSRQQFRDAVDELISDVIVSIFYECLKAVETGMMEVELIGPVLKDMMDEALEKFPDVVRTFLYTLSFVCSCNGADSAGSASANAASATNGAIQSGVVNSELKKLVLSLDIDKSLMLLVLEPNVLDELGIAPPIFEKKLIRQNTNRLYKQKRFNLMREESEGYAKLLVEVYSAARSSGQLQEDSDAFNKKVATAARTVESIIGYFDLDPIRALDIILDVASTNLVDRCHFFMSLLKNSPWWPTEPATGHKSITDIGNGGNKIAAQLLGFKLDIYKSTNTNVSVATPEQLMMLIAVLIKEGFISFGDIYNFLTPDDDKFQEYEEKWKKEMDKKAFSAGASALAMAAPLTDEDDMPSKNAAGGTQPDGADGKTTNGSKDETNGSRGEGKNADDTFLDSPSDKSNIKLDSLSDDSALPITHCPKALLLQCLLSVGSVYPPLYLLSKFPFIIGPYPEIPVLINRLVERSIYPLYESIRSFPPTSIASMTPKLLPVSSIKDTTLAPQLISKTIYVLHPPIDTDGTTSRFFYRDWDSELDLVHNQEELLTISKRYLNFSGPLVGKSISLVVKLCRIGSHFCRPSTANGSASAESVESQKQSREFWLEYFRLYLLPCLSLIEANPGAIYEIYSLLRNFSFEERYALYGEWHAVISKSSPFLKLATSKAEKDTKNVLKRLSKTNVKEMMRKLAKISYSNPIPSFTVFISQVESYDNLGELVIEAARYFTDIGWDALPFVIMMQLTSGRGTQQVDGLYDRKWIQCKCFYYVHLELG